MDSDYEVILGNDILALLPPMTIDYTAKTVSFGFGARLRVVASQIRGPRTHGKSALTRAVENQHSGRILGRRSTGSCGRDARPGQEFVR
ncbi:hypothetical protein Y032_0042g654 [Ancylostoma ceylanicum]|uniref:Uncharacterized protein n=1 Tax=Ancylostoma ceylanicum TaxID=53326 RepID=A0A016UFA7_9BILA|nr:hypothetical protein Y032_0042g654 [Ancylostoma ceylanicum]